MALVLGALAAGVGVGLGILAGFGARPLVRAEHPAQARAGGYRALPVALLRIAGLAVLTGLLGALIPAFSAARVGMVAALAGRRGSTGSRRRWLVVGLAMCGMGAFIAGYGAWSVSVNTVLAGLVIGELGIVLCTSAWSG